MQFVNTDNSHNSKITNATSITYNAEFTRNSKMQIYIFFQTGMHFLHPQLSIFKLVSDFRVGS